MTDKQKAEKGKVMPESVEKLIVDIYAAEGGPKSSPNK